MMFPRRPRRRVALRVGTVGVACVLTGGLLTACGSSDSTSGAASPAKTVSAKQAGLGPFDPNAKAGPATGLPKRVAWANVSSAEFFLSLGSGIKQAAHTAGREHT